MIVSHEWVRGFVPHNRSAQEIGELLSRHCVTLDGIESLRQDLAPFVVGQVMEAGRHPDSDHLWVTKVDDGSGTLLDVVCGAPNVTVGHKYPFARTGTVMPDGLVIAKRKIRGATSNGMLCSSRELGLGAEHDGILTLATDAAPGTPLLQVLPAGDVRLDLDVLPNRPDLLSHRGVAREVSVLTGVALQQPAECPTLPSDVIARCTVRGERSATVDGVTVTIDEASSCTRYVGVVIRGVRVAPSPDWLVARMRAVGARSINNVVDVTNYVLHGLGQPVHAFDLTTLAQQSLVVRAVRAGETLVTLDGTARTLPVGEAAICDGERPVAVAGVMGGEPTEVRDHTTDIVVEVAVFDPKFVRRVRKALGLSTDASYRFERGIDAGFTLEAALHAAAMITSVAGGTVTGILDVGAVPAPRAAVTVRHARVSRLLGVAVSPTECERILVALGCTVAHAESHTAGDPVWLVTPPSWRHDLHLEVDCIEEIARVVGFDVLPDDIRPFRPGTVPDDPLHVMSRRVRDAAVSFGLSETRPMPFVATAPDESLRVRNPLAEDEPYLRTAVMTTLVSRAEYNLSRMQGNVRLFEIGSVFVPSGGRLPREEVRVGALIMGASRPPHFTDPSPAPFDAWDAKALALQLAHAAWPGAPVAVIPSEVGDDAAGVLWRITVGNEQRMVGTVSSVALDRPVWAEQSFGVELTLGVMASDDVAASGANAHARVQATGAGARPPSPWTSLRVTPLPTFPATSFDLALLVPSDLAAARVEEVLRDASGELLEALDLFDEFKGKGIPEGFRSLAWRLTFRHPERTLKEKEIEGRRQRLLQTLDRELGVRPRAG